MNPTVKQCILCKEEFTTTRPNRVYCGDGCAIVARSIDGICKIYYINCSMCGRLAIVRHPLTINCSDGCVSAYESKNKKIIISHCAECGSIIEDSKKRKYCNIICEQKHKEKTAVRYDKVCVYCGKEFYTKRSTAIYCSKICSNKAFKKRIESENNSICSYCGKGFTKTYGMPTFCSTACKKAGRANAVKYLPTVIPEIRIKTTKFNKKCINTWNVSGFNEELKTMVKDRDNWQCYICGKKTNLHVHHIVPRIEGGEHIPENLVTLCGGCHRSVESGNMENAIIKCVARAINQGCA